MAFRWAGAGSVGKQWDRGCHPAGTGGSCLQAKPSARLGGCKCSRTAASGSRSLLGGGRTSPRCPPGFCLKASPVRVVSAQQALVLAAFCSHTACLQSHITLAESKEEMYLLYLAFRQPCLGTVAPILIDYTTFFLDFSSEYDTVWHLNHLNRNLLQRPYHSNFSHILWLCVCVWYFALISSPSSLQ